MNAVNALVEATSMIPVLYHGTSSENADRLLRDGWHPRPSHVGANGGQGRYLYVSTEREDALWFAQQIGSDVVLSLHEIPRDALIVDPEDGTGETVEEELAMAAKTGLPAKLAVRAAIPASRFRQA